MPVLTLEKTAVSRPLLRAVRASFPVPAWSLVLVVAVAALFGYAAGRRHPAHHYVSYFGYPMVLDTTTGKACYATTPKPSEATGLQDAAYSADGQTAPAIPLCGQD